MESDLKNIEKLLNFFAIAGKLKQAIRFSAAKKIKGDSSADHSWRLALMVFTVAEELKLKINIEKAMKIALIHDIAEGLTGEIDYRLIFFGKISKEEKNVREAKAIQKIRKSLPPKLGKEIYDLWQDYENSRSREAKFVKALDKIETTIHLIEAGHKKYDFPELIALYPDKAVSDFPELKGFLKAVKERLKKEFRKGKFPWKKEYNRFVAN
ncbi:MAG: HD domain-containing protein [Candidatus Moranbacteria bacterium]|nr:HD domain-containing protein [Candidatus Moranbacteria bacterium]